MYDDDMTESYPVTPAAAGSPAAADLTTGVPRAARPRPIPASAAAPHQPKNRPDPTPVRLALGAGGLAVLSAVAAAIVVAPAAAAPALTTTTRTEPAAAATAAPTTVAVNRQVRYVQLAPGQSAPPGAKVIDAAAPKPITVVTRVAAPAQRPIVIKTTQSGKVVP